MQRSCVNITQFCVLNTQNCAYNTQMARSLTITDLCEISGYSRHQMRGLLDELPVFNRRVGSARIAKTYSSHDLFLVALFCRLETRFGLKRQIICALATEIADVLGGSNKVTKAGRLILTYEPTRVTYVEQLQTNIDDGLVISLAPVISLVDDYLLPASAAIPVHQTEINFGLHEVSSNWRLRMGRKEGP